MEHQNGVPAIPQYRLGKILLIWAAAAIPMGILGWFVAPALAHDPQKPGFERLAVLTVGLVWQFVLVVFLLYRETGTLRWSTLRQRLWLNTPRSPQTGEPLGRLWWWLIPVILLTAIYEMQVGGIFDKLWVSIFPFFAEPRGFSLGAALDAPEAKTQMVGAWGIWGLFLLSALFNTFLGEELLFRGLLLPRMAGVFGKWDWVMNGRSIHRILDQTFGDGSKVDEKTALLERQSWLQWSIFNQEWLPKLHQPPYGDRAITLKTTGAVIGAIGYVPLLDAYEQIPELSASTQLTFSRAAQSSAPMSPGVIT